MKSNNHTLWKVLHEKIGPGWFHSVFLDRSRNYLYGIDYEPIEQILPELNKIVIKEKPDKLDFLAGENAQFIKYVIESYREQMKVCWDVSSKKDKFWEQFFKNDESWRKVTRRKGSDSESQHSDRLSNINSKEIESNMHRAENPQNASQSGLSDRRKALRSDAEAPPESRQESLAAAEELAASRRRANMLQNELKNLRNDLASSGNRAIVLEGRNEMLVKFIKDSFAKAGNENEALSFDRTLNSLRKLDGKELQSLGIDKVLLSKKSELLAKLVIHTTSLIKGVDKSTNTAGPDYEDLPLGDAEAFSAAVQGSRSVRMRRPSDLSRARGEKSRHSISKLQASKSKLQQQSSHLLRQKKLRQAAEPSANADFSVRLEEASAAEEDPPALRRRETGARLGRADNHPRKKSAFHQSEQPAQNETPARFGAAKRREVEVEENEEVTAKPRRRSPSPNRATDRATGRGAEFRQPQTGSPSRPKDMYEVGLASADPKALLNRILNAPPAEARPRSPDPQDQEAARAPQRQQKGRVPRHAGREAPERSQSGPNELSNEVSSLDKNHRLAPQNFFDDPSIKSARVFHSTEARRQEPRAAVAEIPPAPQTAGRKLSVMSTLPMSFDPNPQKQASRNATSQGFGNRKRIGVASPLQSPASVKKRIKIRADSQRPGKELVEASRGVEVRKESIDIGPREKKRARALQPINPLGAAEHSEEPGDSDKSLGEGKEYLAPGTQAKSRVSRKKALGVYVVDSVQIAQAQDPKMGMYFKLTPNVRLNKLMNGPGYAQTKPLEDLDRQVFVYLSRPRGERNRAQGEEKLKQLLQEKNAEIEKMKSRRD